MKYLILCFAILLSGCLKEKIDPALLPVQIKEPYAFATIPGAAAGAAFMVITNKGEEDKLLAANSKIAEFTEIHQNMIDPDDGTMMMRKVSGIVIPPKAKAVLEPTGYHIMFLKLKQPLTIGIDVPVKLAFEKAGIITVNVKVIAPGTKPGDAP